ncbi:MAG: FtsW/RodA/SpoVE family cell cycle protein [Clostridiales bacterium]|nr:FtsW/RodA/SpoVE family cell cycle protein [Clostridiales bacterium]
MNKQFFKNLEWKVLICSLLLLAIGLFALYSATINKGLVDFTKQVRWFVVSIPFLLFFTLIDYNKILKYSGFFYLIFLGLLVGVLFTKPISGATSWYNLGEFSFQPSEIGKIFILMFIVATIVRLQYKGKDEINKLYKLIISLIVAAIPIALIIRQPDYGTALAYIFAFIAILYVGGLRKRYIFLRNNTSEVLVYI